MVKRSRESAFSPSVDDAKVERKDKSIFLELVKNDGIESLKELQESDKAILPGLVDGEGNSPFHIASASGNIELFTYLENIQALEDASCQRRNFKGETPLLLAVANNHFPMVSFLLSNGSFIEERDDKGCTSLLRAAGGEEDQLEILALLLSLGSSFKEKDNMGMNALHYASARGHIKIVKYLSKRIPVKEEEDYWSHQRSSLEHAAENGHLQIVSYFLTEHRETATANSLVAAAGRGHLEIVKLLLNSISLAEIEWDGGNALHCAARAGHLEIVRLLLSRGMPVNATYYDWSWGGLTSLDCAAKEGHFEVFNFLISEWKAEVQGQNLLTAAIGGNLKIVKLLLSLGMSLEEKHESENKNCLHFAAEGGHLDLVEYFVSLGMSVNDASRQGTSLFYATEGGYLDVVRFLLESGATPETNSLCTAASKGYIDILKILVSKGNLLLEPSYDGLTPGMTSLRFAAESGHIDIVKYLVAAGCSPNEPDLNFNCLLTAARQGHFDVVKYFLSLGMSIKDIDFAGMTTLLYAAQLGDVNMVAYCLSLGSSIHERNVKGEDCLILESKLGHLGSRLNVVKYLVAQGCSVNHKNEEGNSALTFAAYRNRPLVVEFLILNGAAIVSSYDTFCFGDGRINFEELSQGVLELLVNAGLITVEEVKTNSDEYYFSRFIAEMRRKKTVKRAVH